MVTVIVQSTAIVAATGIENLTQQLQISAPDNASSVIASGPISNISRIVTSAGIGENTRTLAFQGPGTSTAAITTHGAGQTGILFGNVLQNPSFEENLRRWSTVLGDSGDFVVSVHQQPVGIGFDDTNPVAPINGIRMAHISKFEPDGVVALVQAVDVTLNDDTNLGTFSFSVCSDTLFRPDTTDVGGLNGKYFDIAIEFLLSGSVVYSLNYNFTGAERPDDFPPVLLPFDRTILLTLDNADIFETFSRDLSADVLGSFDFDAVRLWFIQGQTGTILTDQFDTLLDDITLSIGVEQPSLDATSEELPFIVFSPDFSRAARLFGVVGTSGTAEKFFDHSPFFFGPHETDPNTLRDLSEAQQFLVFTQTSIRSFSNFNNTTGGVPLITTKGDTVSADSLAPLSIVSNGGFESDFSNWEVVSTSGLDSVSVVSEIPHAGVGQVGALPAFEGDLCLYVITDGAGLNVRDAHTVRQVRKLGQKFSSSILNQLSFVSAISSTSHDRQTMLVVRFLNNSVSQSVIQYQLNGVPDRMPDEISDFDVRIDLNTSATVWVLSLRNIFEDMHRSDFFFDEVEIWLVSNSANTSDTNQGWDDIALTINVTNLDLLKTDSVASIFTGHPTASGFPFTISGSDDITAIDLAPPFFDEEVPASGTSFNPVTSSVVFHVKDAGTALDVGSIDVFIGSEQVVAGGTGNTSATFPTVTTTVISSRDRRYEATRFEPFPQQSIVTVSGDFADLASPGNGTTETYQFTLLGSGTFNASITGLIDADPPVITPVNPVDLATHVSPSTHILWTTSDDASGVDPSTLIFTVDSQVALINDLGQTGIFSRVANANLGFDYDFTPTTPFEFGQTVTGTISVADFAAVPNTGTLTYEFTITPDETLDITNFFMGSGETLPLASGTVASVDVIDLTHGVNPATTSLTVNSVVPAGLVITQSGAGPGRLIFEFEVEPLTTFREDLNIFVHAENKFPGSFPVVQEANFVLRPGYGVNWQNKNLDPDLPGPESQFPLITNIHVLAEVKNFAKTFNTGTEFYRFLTESLSRKDLGATLESNIKIADLSAFLNVQNPFYEYGKTMTLEVEVADLEGNQFSFTHVFTIEQDPS